MTFLTPIQITERLNYLREEIEAERISTGEILELQNLKDYIPADDVVLLEWAGVPELTVEEVEDASEHTHWCDMCQEYTTTSDSNPYGTCQCS